MTSVPRNSPKKNDTRTYSLWEWTRAYLVLAAFSPIYVALWALATFVKVLPPIIVRKLLRDHVLYTNAHEMDFRIPPDKTIPAYMHRWWRIARNWAFNIYYHVVLRSDDDRALHDHPWWSFSIVLEGGYWEHEIKDGGIHRKTWYGPGSMRFRYWGTKAHRLELKQIPARDTIPYDATAADQWATVVATTIFITGPVMRRWGFHATEKWIDAYDWDDYCDRKGITGMRMDGGSDAAISPRNLIS